MSVQMNEGTSSQPDATLAGKPLPHDLFRNAGIVKMIDATMEQDVPTLVASLRAAAAEVRQQVQSGNEEGANAAIRDFAACLTDLGHHVVKLFDLGLMDYTYVLANRGGGRTSVDSAQPTGLSDSPWTSGVAFLKYSLAEVQPAIWSLAAARDRIDATGDASGESEEAKAAMLQFALAAGTLAHLFGSAPKLIRLAASF